MSDDSATPVAAPATAAAPPPGPSGQAVVVAPPWLDDVGVAGAIRKGIASLVGGMRVTGRYVARPSTVVTQHYPENRETLRLPDRFRGALRFHHDADGYHGCTVCRICEDQCPNRSIVITQRDKGALTKKELDAFVWRLDACTFCNTCVQVCPFNVLHFGPGFESAVYDRRLLVYTLNGYAGPTAALLNKVADPQARKAACEPRDPFCGPTVLQALADQRAARRKASELAQGVGLKSPATFEKSAARTAPDPEPVPVPVPDPVSAVDPVPVAVPAPVVAPPAEATHVG